MKRKRLLKGSMVRKRSVLGGTHKTSLIVEEEFWQRLQEMARD